MDCSSLTELMMSERCGFRGPEIMFSSNDTPAEDFRLAAELGATINLDDITHIDFLKETIGRIPETISAGITRAGHSGWMRPRTAPRSWTTPVRPSTA